MSSFTCEICGTDIIDSENGYITECEHWALEPVYKGDKTLKRFDTCFHPSSDLLNRMCL